MFHLSKDVAEVKVRIKAVEDALVSLATSALHGAEAAAKVEEVKIAADVRKAVADAKVQIKADVKADAPTAIALAEKLIEAALAAHGL
jgi:hypothetical protein